MDSTDTNKKSDADSSDKNNQDELPPELAHRKTIEPTIITDDGNSTNETETTITEEPTERTIDIAEIDRSWKRYFPYDQPYVDQVDGINTYFESLADYKNMVMEGACGTGKTLIALCAAIAAIRNEDELAEEVTEVNESGEKYETPNYQRVFAATPVKQQLKQFIQEMGDINDSLKEGQTPVNTLVLRGKSDMLGLSHVSHPPLDEDYATEHVDKFRKQAVRLIKFDSSIPLDWPKEINPPEWSKADFNWEYASKEAEEMRESRKYDPYRVAAVYQILQHKAKEEENHLTISDTVTPYPNRIPDHTDIIPDEVLNDPTNTSLNNQTITNTDDDIPQSWKGKFDPFFVGYHNFDQLPIRFSQAKNNVLDKSTLIPLSVEYGICPHLVMGDYMKKAEVLIGNYYHVFDPQTRMLTDKKGEVIDKETICIIDEAHNIERTVRDILSDGCDLRALQQAKNDIEAIIAYSLNSYDALPESERESISKQECLKAYEELGSNLGSNGGLLPGSSFSNVTLETLNEVKSTLNELEKWLLTRSKKYLNNEFPYNWRGIDDPESESIALEEPQEQGTDELTDQIEARFGDDIWQTMSHACAGVKQAFNKISVSDREVVCDSVGSLFYQWTHASRVKYFREIKLEAVQKKTTLDTAHEWTKKWTPKYQLYNSIPTERIREVFSEFGSTLLMSATLEPLDVFIRTTGVGECITPRYEEDRKQRKLLIRSGEADEVAVKESTNIYTDVVERQYPLRFPKQNRFSGIVTANKYTGRNRGDQTTSKHEMTDTRRIYANVIEQIARTEGSVLICMPSYSEAWWANRLLRQRKVNEKVDSIILDQSSESWVTDNKLKEFFDTENGVLITSTRGTITEGVDYKDDKLDVCAVIGIPLLPPSEKQMAIENAYDKEISGVSGREATNKIPATRKARQAIGRVIRGPNEVGVRLFVDKRYAYSNYGGVQGYLSEDERDEFREIKPARVKQELDKFWEMHQMS